ncbi:interleukin-21 receptor-like [Scleropages formosus]|uniref:Fibronectin type-III domain-containing protein n=1 Tax=Scleropages formosus TaxID=113540 RepID=A0A8C9VUR9_SCLFO|nr:interleukin-21 receptor [Scleropages formosus]
MPIMDLQQSTLITYFLFGLIQYTACVCNITCTTDYMSSLNCSCSAQALLSPYTLIAECWNESENGNGSCEIVPPQRWCKTAMDNFDLIVNIDANCTAWVNNTNAEDSKEYSDSIYFMLHKHIKPEAPFSVQVTEDNSGYNISWEMEDVSMYLKTFLWYRVRVRTKDEPLEDFHTIKEDRQYLEIPYDNLKPEKEYVADVQVTVNPSEFQASWSEWSPIMKWKTKSKKQEPSTFLFLLLSSVPCLLLCYFGIMGWLKWLQLCRYVPSPEDFFKPLYHTYNGDFQRWVGPTFTLSQFDLLEKNVVVQVAKEKQLEPPEKPSEGKSEFGGRRGSRESQDPGTSSVLSLSSHSSSKHLLGNSIHDTTHLNSHISIHTVTVSGEESTASGILGKSYGNSQPNGCFFPYFTDCEGDDLVCQEQKVLDMDMELLQDKMISECQHADHEPALDQHASFGLYNLDWQLGGVDQEAERLSLESFCSNDAYPHLELDLDTIDSGFLDSDCTSPVDSELNGNKVVLAEVGKPQSNYIRQWVTYGPTACTQGVSIG